MITIFTDGSSKGNPGPGGWGSIIATEKDVIEIGGSKKHTTNNKMELTAAIKALEEVKKFDREIITLFSDSTYVVKGITEWIYGWQKRGWKKADKKPVENQDLWQELFDVSRDLNINWKIVEGHSGVRANERCDEIATSFADNIKIDLFKNSRNLYKVSLNGKIT